jgi:hypothetical protein
MAKAVVNPPTEPTYTLELSADEAHALIAVVGACNGRHLDDVYRALDTVIGYYDRKYTWHGTTVDLHANLRDSEPPF